jgi:hypothetical protein
VDLGSLFAKLMQLHDKRDARGLRYALVTVLVYVVLAKLSGENVVRGIAEWVKHRKEALGEALGLAQPQAPHATTYSRILGYAIDGEEFQRVVGDFFAQWPAAGQSAPVQVARLGGIVAVAEGNAHTLALRRDGTVWAWGSNQSGQLGVETIVTRTTPVQVVAPAAP